MTILIDTHIFLWAITEDPRLSAEHRSIYLETSNQLYISVAAVWEMLIKSGLGTLPLPRPAAAYIAKQLEKNRVEIMNIRPAHLAALETLPPLHRDPFDRMMVAQASAEGLPLMSADPAFKQYSIKTF